jgi:hypothetical protein
MSKYVITVQVGWKNDYPHSVIVENVEGLTPDDVRPLALQALKELAPTLETSKQALGHGNYLASSASIVFYLQP